MLRTKKRNWKKVNLLRNNRTRPRQSCVDFCKPVFLNTHNLKRKTKIELSGLKCSKKPTPQFLTQERPESRPKRKRVKNKTKRSGKLGKRRAMPKSPKLKKLRRSKRSKTKTQMTKMSNKPMLWKSDRKATDEKLN